MSNDKPPFTKQQDKELEVALLSIERWCNRAIAIAEKHDPGLFWVRETDVIARIRCHLNRVCQTLDGDEESVADRVKRLIDGLREERRLQSVANNGEPPC